MNQQELAQLHHEAKAELMKIPGVVAVGYGRKERAGRITDEVAFRVYVTEKKKLSDVKVGEVIPPAYNGVPTDVVEPGEGELLAGVCDDHETHSPLIGGIAITNFKPVLPSPQSEGGTLGFFAFILGITGYNNIALISCNHVLGAAEAKVGDTIYQPSWELDEGEWIPNPGSNPIGEIIKLPEQGYQWFTYPNESPEQYWTDCAAAQLDICVSPTCKTNCKQSFANSQRGMDLNGSSAITDVSRLKQSDMGQNVVVYKSGGVSGVTQGTVIDPFGITKQGRQNVILIQPAGPNCHGNTAFGEKGDSGSAILNEKGQLLGVLFARDPATGIGYGCHIDPVLVALDLELVPVTTVNAPVNSPAYVANVPAAMAAVKERRENVALLRKRLLKTVEGARFEGLVETHGPEVMQLVNHNRRVTVAWHRNKGPRFLNEAAANLSDPRRSVPREIDGVARETLVRRMAEALMKHGSKGLREAVERLLDDAVSYVNRADSVPEMVDLFSKAHTA